MIASLLIARAHVGREENNNRPSLFFISWMGSSPIDARLIYICTFNVSWDIRISSFSFLKFFLNRLEINISSTEDFNPFLFFFFLIDDIPFLENTAF